MTLWNKLLIWPIAAIVLLAALFYLVNFFKQELDPEAAAFADFTADTVPDAENAYFSMLGFHAESGRDIHAVGVAFANTVRHALVENPMSRSPEAQEFLGANPINFSGDATVLCEHRQAGCLDAYKRSAHQIGVLLSENQVLLDRYYDMYRYRHFREAIPMTLRTPLPIYPGDVQKLVLASISMQLQDNEIAIAVEALSRDIQFWRLVLRDSHDLISKMVALAFVKRDVLFVSDLVRSYGLNERQVKRLRGTLRPLSREERDMSPAIRREFSMMVHTFQNMESLTDDGAGTMFGSSKTHDVVLWPLFDVNATVNVAYPWYEELAKIATLPAHEFEARLLEMKTVEPSRNPFYYFHNPIGKILWSVAQPDYAQYIVRIHNLDGLIRAVALHVEIKSRRIKDDDIPNFIETIGPGYYNPYTRKPMQWDAGESALVFEGMARKRGKEKVIRVNL